MSKPTWPEGAQERIIHASSPVPGWEGHCDRPGAAPVNCTCHEGRRWATDHHTIGPATAGATCQAKEGGWVQTPCGQPMESAQRLSLPGMVWEVGAEQEQLPG